MLALDKCSFFLLMSLIEFFLLSQHSRYCHVTQLNSSTVSSSQFTLCVSLNASLLQETRKICQILPLLTIHINCMYLNKFGILHFLCLGKIAFIRIKVLLFFRNRAQERNVETKLSIFTFIST